MKPYFADDTVTLYAGDCRDALAVLPDASVDAVVTDPPYELGFMGRAWDASGIAYDVDMWRQCLRVLKPGGHLLAFGGTRTYHRLTVAIEDAGFEIRDSLHWIYGSGFPKSLDVSKAIDKRRPDQIAHVGEFLRLAIDAGPLTRREIGQRFGLDPRGVDLWAPRPTDKSAQTRAHVPTWEQWERLRGMLGFGNEMDAEVWRLNGRKGTPGEAWDRREVLKERTMTQGGGTALQIRVGDRREVAANITAPATDDARRWQGWGTALKPSHEPVVVAQKPAGSTGILASIGSHLERLEAECASLANAAEPSSRPTPATEPRAKVGSAPESAATPPAVEHAKRTPTGAADGSPEATATSVSESTAATCLSTVTSWRRCWVALCELTSTSTTSTTNGTTTDLRTLSFSLSKLTAVNMAASLSPTSGSPSLAEAVDSLFAAAVLRSRATLALSAAGIATDGTPTSLQDGVARAKSEPAHEPIVLARKPLAGTVSATVLAHGTGGLSIDGCRTPTSPADAKAMERANTPGSGRMKAGGSPIGTFVRSNPTGAMDTTQGRWPTNVVLTHQPLLDDDGDIIGDACADGCVPGCPVADMDAQSGRTASQRRTRPPSYGATAGVHEGWRRPAHADYHEKQNAGYDDTGGASRFFPVFRYEPKAPASERPRGEDGTAHATVKPLALMRWLVRLVTQPGGLVCDPFLGSGTTAEACVVEGFRCVGIERDPTHLPLIKARLAKPIQPILGFEDAS